MLTIAGVKITRMFMLGIVAILAILAFALIDGDYANGTFVHELIQWCGFMAIFVSIYGRTWTFVYICDRKNAELVRDGPYSVVRNPLYFFSIVGTAGATAQIGSVTLAVIFGFLVWLVLYMEIINEERVLAALHGQEFLTYKASVPRLLPNLRLWRDVPSLPVNPAKLLVSFADSSLFLLSLPFAECLEFLRSSGYLPTLLRLP
jgi:protein-S-isoprenylcysteine O-methyltransferase Ste14